MDKYLSFVTIDVWTLIFTWCNLLILFLLMKKFLFGPISNILKQRDEEINNLYADAEEKNTIAEQKEIEYTEKLENAKNEASQIVDNAVKNAGLRSDDIISEAEKKASEMIKRADKQIQLERTQVLNEAKADISSISISIAEKLIKKDMSDNDHKRLVDDIINEMGEN